MLVTALPPEPEPEEDHTHKVTYSTLQWYPMYSTPPPVAVASVPLGRGAASRAKHDVDRFRSRHAFIITNP